jgi:hypothetical protein
VVTGPPGDCSAAFGTGYRSSGYCLKGELMRTLLFLLMLLIAGCSQGGLNQSRQVAPTGAHSPKDVSTAPKDVSTAPKDASTAPKDVSTEDLAQRLAADCAFLRWRQFLERLTPKDRIPTIDAIARRPGLSASQRAARLILLTPIASTWDDNVKISVYPLQRSPLRTCEELLKAAEKDLLATAQAWSKNYAGWKDRQKELNRWEIQLNELITKENAKVVQAAEKAFHIDQFAEKVSVAVEQELAQAFAKVLKANPDLEKELRTSLRAERAAVTKDLEASRAKADSMLHSVDGQP